TGMTISEPIGSLNGNGFNGVVLGAIHNQGASNTWAGDIILAGTTFVTADTGTSLTLSGAISGVQTLIKAGLGTLAMAGSRNNTYGTTQVNQGILKLNKTAGINAIGGALVVGNDGGGANVDVVQQLQANQIPDGSAVTVASSGKYDT